jgi:hypothetical protein
MNITGSISPDGRTLVAVSSLDIVSRTADAADAMLTQVGDNPEIYLFNVQPNGEFESKFKINTPSSTAMFSTCWTLDSQTFAVACQSGYVLAFDVRSDKPLARINTTQMGSGGSPRVVKFSQDHRGGLLAFTEHRNYLHLIDAKTWNEGERLEIPMLSRNEPSNLDQFDYNSRSMISAQETFWTRLEDPWYRDIAMGNTGEDEIEQRLRRIERENGGFVRRLENSNEKLPLEMIKFQKINRKNTYDLNDNKDRVGDWDSIWGQPDREPTPFPHYEDSWLIPPSIVGDSFSEIERDLAKPSTRITQSFDEEILESSKPFLRQGRQKFQTLDRKSSLAKDLYPLFPFIVDSFQETLYYHAISLEGQKFTYHLPLLERPIVELTERINCPPDSVTDLLGLDWSPDGEKLYVATPGSIVELEIDRYERRRTRGKSTFA